MSIRNLTRYAIASLLMATSIAVHAQLPWSDQTHQIAFGDFNGDGRTDVLYVARDSGQSSGIALSTGGGPYLTGQTWASNHLGITWGNSAFKPIVADFNGDRRADILLQRQVPGDHYLLFADATGQITGIYQTIANSTGGQNWSPDAHRIVAGDFNGDSKADLFLQSASMNGLNAVFLAGSSGSFSGTQQTWGNVHIGFQWSSPKATVQAADFDGDGKTDLFIQAKADVTMLDTGIGVLFPVPSYRPGSFGVANAKTPNVNGEIFFTPALQVWDRKYQNTDWSANFYEAIVGDFNGDRRADILLQGRSAGQLNVLFQASSNGQFTTADALVDTTIRNATGNQYRLYAANFAGTPSSAVYLQANTSGGTSSVQWNGTPTLGSESIAYTYDAKGRLTKVVHTGTVNNNVTTDYAFDKTDNRTSVVTTNAP